MAFTNTWDTTFPADTQLANLLGQDIRNFKLDIQQRMGAISGLDASKPAFNTDAQPANWNGILFFATDTGRIYQFSNPNWVDVTLSFGGQKYAARTIVIQTGDTIAHTIYTVTIPAGVFQASTRVRIRAPFFITSGAAGASPMAINFGGTAIFSVAIQNYGTGGSEFWIEGGNFGNASSQTWDGFASFNASSPTRDAQVTTSAINTANAVNVTLTWTPNANANNITFYGMSIELF